MKTGSQALFKVAWLVMLGALPSLAQSRQAELIPKVTPQELILDLNYVQPVKPWKPGDSVKEISQRYDGQPITEPFKSARLDPLLAPQSLVKLGSGGPFGTPSLLVEGQAFTGANPPDPVGAVGIRYYIQATNGNQVTFSIYHKSDGSLAAGPFAMADFVPCGSRGDPIVLYDQAARRWLLASLGHGPSLCVLISKTPDPIKGGWWVYGFQTPHVPDFLKIGVWPQGYMVTSNEPNPAVYAMERTAMLAGKPAGLQRFQAPGLSGFTFQSLTPSSWDGRTPPEPGPAYFLRQRDIQIHGSPLPGSKSDLLERFELTINWDQPALSLWQGPFALEVAPFDSTLCGLNRADCIPQPDGPALDPLREIIMNRLVYRQFPTHETLLGNFSVDVDGLDHIGIRWFELRKQKGKSWTLYQEGTFAPDQNHRWLGTPAMDALGNMALAYQISSATRYPGLRYSGRQKSDPLGVLTRGEHLLAEGTAANGTSRYGDYMAMTLDPIDDCTFWVTGMYNPSTMWATKIARFAFNTLPDGPKNVLASVNQTNAIHLTWDMVPAATSYSIFRKIGGCDDSFYQLLAEGLSEPAFVDHQVSAGFQYSYKIRYHAGPETCASNFSHCVSQIATGTCTKVPIFEGVTDVQSAQQPTCGIKVTWEPPKFSCPEGMTFHIYRALQPGFSASEENRIASCISGIEYIDRNVQPNVAYYYQVRAEDGSNTGNGPCNSGNQDRNTREAVAMATGPLEDPLSCSFSCIVEPQLWPPMTIQNFIDCVNHPKL